MAAAMKHMASNFAKLDKFEGVNFRRWQKKMHFLLCSMSVVYVMTTPIPEDGGDDATDSLEAKYIAEDASSKKFLVSNFTNYKMTDSRPVMEQYNELLGILGRFTQHKMNMDEAIQVSFIIDKLPPSWKDFKHTLKHLKDELTLVELGSHLCIEESLRVQDSDKPKGNNVAGPSVVNMVEHNNSSRYNDNKGKRKHHDNTRTDPNKKAKPTCWKCGKIGHIKRDCKCVKIGNKANGSGTKGSHARLSHVHYKRMQDMSKDGLILAFDMDTENYKTCMLNKITKKPFQNVKRETKVLELIHSDLCDLHATPSLGNKKYFVTFIDDASRFCYIYLLHTKDEALDKFKVFKTEVELQQGSLIKRFRTDRGGKYMDTLYFQSVGIIYETTAPYTPQKNGISKRKNRVLKEMVNSMLSYLGLSQGFWGKAMLTACYLLNKGCKAVVRLPDPKLKNLGERGIKCIFVGYAEHSKAFRFFVIEPNESVSINSIIESRDTIFDENRFSSVHRLSQRSLKDGTEDIGGSVVPEKVTKEVVQQPEPELRKSKRNRNPKNFRPKFQLYLIEGTRDEVSDQHSSCFNVEDDLKTFDEAMRS
ncbi:zinc finger, CCHC-type containing protein [Tanacetum coccineum]